MFIWRMSRAQSVLEQWASQNGYEIVESERRILRRGSFWWRTGKGQKVYRVRIVDRTGRQRSGYVRCGGMFLGMMSDAADVEWDD